MARVAPLRILGAGALALAGLGWSGAVGAQALEQDRPRRIPAGAPRLSAGPVVPVQTYYRNCDDARAMGAAPLHRGAPGYRPELDADGDGVACEPYGRKR